MSIEQWIEYQLLQINSKRKIDKSYDRGYVDALLDMRNHLILLAYLTSN